MIILTYKYRLRPTKKQRFILDDILDQMRMVYNDALAERKWWWRRSRKSVSYYDQSARFTKERADNPLELNLLNASSGHQLLRRLDNTYREFLKGNRGFPRFKSNSRFKSVEYIYNNGSKLIGDRLRIQHVGEIKVFLHRLIPDDAKIKRVVLKKTNEKWYACFVLELPSIEMQKRNKLAVGIDVGIKSLLALSNGTLVDNPRWLRQSLRQLRVAQRKLSRRRKLSIGWNKTKKRVSKLHEHIANQRKDFWHKVTTELVNDYDFIAIEDLNLSFMTKGNLALSAHDASLGMFRQMLEYKVEKTGIQLVVVNPYNTTQVCSGCGSIVKKGLDVRTHSCPDCGLVLDRDINAACNILSLGLRDEALTYSDTKSVVSEAPK